jgi:hypothetical protein
VKEKKPSIVFLIETLCSTKYMEHVRSCLGFESLFVVEPMGRSEGLALLWMDTQPLDIFNYSWLHIDAVVKDSDWNAQWRFTGFYGQPNSARRDESWALLKHLKTFQPLPWLCVGDFNLIVEKMEKHGVATNATLRWKGFGELWRIVTFQIWVTLDHVLRGAIYHCTDDSFTQERLDRAVANCEWCILFPYVTAPILAACSSDHNPILVYFTEQPEESHSYRRGFKFEAAWIKDDEYQGIVQNAWETKSIGAEPIRVVKQRFSSCQQKLSQWSKKKFGQAEDILKKKKQQFLDLQSKASPSLDAAIKTLQGEIDEILAREDMQWKQHAKKNWYLHED